MEKGVDIFPGIHMDTLSEINQSLIDIIPGGVIGIDIELGRILFVSEGMYQLLGYDRVDIKDMCLKELYYSMLHPEDQVRVKHSVTKQIRDKGRAQVCYRLLKKDGSYIWVKQLAGHSCSPKLGKYFLCILSDFTETQNALDEAKEEREKTETLINTIPGGVARISVGESLKILLASDGYYGLVGYTQEECRMEPINSNPINFILPEDVPPVTKALEELLQSNRPVCAEYRIRKKDGSITWNTAYCSKVQRHGKETVMDVVFIDSTDMKKTENRLVGLVNTVPGGVVRMYINEEIVVHFANDGFYDMIGYSQGEFAGEPIQKKYDRIVHQEDRAMVMDKVRTYINTDKVCSSLDYRIRKKDGEIRWMRASASRINTGIEQLPVIQCIISDITEEKKMAKQAAIHEERYRIISEQTQDIVFECDLETKMMHLSPVYKVKFGADLPMDYSLVNILETDFIHKQDRPVIEKLIEDLYAGIPYLEAEYRKKKSDGSYIWCRNRMKSIFDENHQPIRIVGVLSDIDEEKRNTASLLERAQRDSLTGLLNRMAFQERVKDSITLGGDENGKAFLLFDIDNFKWINDMLGHMTGDMVLKDFADLLTSEFEEIGFVGRLGGDEFAVFLEKVISKDAIYEKSEYWNRMLKSHFTYLKYGCRISSSIGITFYPGSENTFQGLYRCADVALYQSKQKGRNCYSVYSSEKEKN